MFSAPAARVTRALILCIAASGAIACAQQRRNAPGQEPGRATDAPQSTEGVDLTEIYQSMGLIAATGQMPFVGRIGYLSGAGRDSTLLQVSLSMPATSLRFVNSEGQFVGSYSVRLELRQGTSLVRALDAQEFVRVPTFKETSRTDEAVIWQQFLQIAPGQYLLNIAVRDDSTLRSTSRRVALDVPRLDDGALSTPLVVYHAIPRQRTDSLPRLMARPRASATFGEDSLLGVYVESARPRTATSVLATLVNEDGIELWRDSIGLAVNIGVNSGVNSGDNDGGVGAATFGIPVRFMDFGTNTVVIARANSTDVVRTSLRVSLGESLPLSGFSDLLGYLRYFASAERLDSLRMASVNNRHKAWTVLLRETDPVPATSEHEGFRDYVVRLREANQRYRADGPVGWQTDRGTAYVALGDPDNILLNNGSDPIRNGFRNRKQIWEYHQLRLRLTFTDETGLGRWRLSSSGRNNLHTAIRNKLAHRTERPEHQERP